MLYICILSNKFDLNQAIHVSHNIELFINLLFPIVHWILPYLFANVPFKIGSMGSVFTMNDVENNSIPKWVSDLLYLLWFQIYRHSNFSVFGAAKLSQQQGWHSDIKGTLL